MPFEFDLPKSASNKLKHGIDFVEAQALWQSNHVELEAKDATEKRYPRDRRHRDTALVPIITYRGMTIRIISVRKSTPNEIAVYTRDTR